MAGQMPSGWPSQEGEKYERPSKHIFDGFSYCFKSLLIEYLNLRIEPLGIYKTELGDYCKRNLSFDFSNWHMIRILFSRCSERYDQTHRATESFQHKDGARASGTSAVLLKSNVNTETAPANLALVIQRLILQSIYRFFLLIPAIKIFLHILILTHKEPEDRVFGIDGLGDDEYSHGNSESEQMTITTVCGAVSVIKK